jgi:hypothetical protein
MRRAVARWTARLFSSPSFRKGLLGVACLAVVFFSVPQTCAEKPSAWPGVDESVVEKYAQEHGRKAQEPLINTDQGDLLLFVFLLAGALGGFTAGYSWKTLMEQRTKSGTAGKEGQQRDASVL